MTVTAEIAANGQAPDFVRLRQKIGWICHSLRLAITAYAAWVLYLEFALWFDAETIHQRFERLLHTDVSAFAEWQRWAALSIDLGLWALAAVACYCGWRLCSTYLEGRVFSVEAARWMQRLASVGIFAQLLAIASRPLIMLTMTAHLPAAQQRAFLFLQPNDLLTLLLLLCILGLAHIQRAGAEMAAEHAQIV